MCYFYTILIIKKTEMHKKLILLLITFVMIKNIQAQSTQTSENMWLSYNPSYTTFKLFSPEADEAIVKIYQQANDKMPFKTVKQKMEFGEQFLMVMQKIYFTLIK